MLLNSADDALLRYSHVQEIRKPKVEVTKTFQEWLDRPEGGDFFLRGREAEIWEDEADLVTLDKSAAEDDSLTRLISDRLIPWYHYRWGHRLRVSHH